MLVHPIDIYDTATQKKVRLKTLEPNHVKLYVCGNTVYDDCHIGHARVFVAFDVVVRFLKAMGYQVTYVRNITDIDDKIIARAKEQGKSIQDLTEYYIARLQEDCDKLLVNAPTHQPRATQYVEKMTHLIQHLIEKNMAYLGDNGDVYFRVKAFDSYGVLSHRSLESLQEGARVAVDQHKENPLDFVLWKKAKIDEPHWQSPFGEGRPGWHIECSAMSMDCLGAHFDLHGGGADLLFPHHENERAQSVGATDKPFVNTWMHVGFVQIDGEKMSKSLGNFFTIREVLAEIHPEVLRYLLLASHYRSQIHYSREACEAAKQSLIRLYTALKSDLLMDEEKYPLVEPYYGDFIQAMSDDFNTPLAVSVLFSLANAIFKQEDKAEQAALRKTLLTCGQILGIFSEAPQIFLQNCEPGAQLSPEEIECEIANRHAARSQKNWAEADRIRAFLLEKGVQLEDISGKTTWRRV